MVCVVGNSPRDSLCTRRVDMHVHKQASVSAAIRFADVLLRRPSFLRRHLLVCRALACACAHLCVHAVIAFASRLVSSLRCECRMRCLPTLFLPDSPTLLYLETFLHLDATCYLNSNVTAILPSARRRQSTGQAPAGRGTAGDSAASGEGAPAAGRGSASSTTASGQEAPAGGRGSASSSTASGQEAPAGGRGSASGGGEQGSSESEAGFIERGKGPIGNGPLAQGDYSYDGCGKKIALRQIPSATHLRNWLAIAARASDIWFVTLPPSGSIKDAPMSLIANLTSAVKVTGHTEFHDWAADPTGAGLKTSGRLTKACVYAHVYTHVDAQATHKSLRAHASIHISCTQMREFTLTSRS